MANSDGGMYLRTAGESPVRQWWGMYYGYIAVNQDPLAMGRVKLRVPQVFGSTTSGWASPMVPLTFIPQVGTAATVMFVGGDPTQPVYFGNFALPAPGTPVSVGASPPASPELGEIWVDSSDGLMHEWNGAGWVAYQIGAGSIAAGAITNGLLATGAIDGFTINGATINGNTVNAADIIVSGNSGGIFIYGSGASIVQTFTSSTTWTCPPGVTSITVECWGGGGGGGGGATGTANGGGGGGGSEYASEVTVAVTPGNVYTITIGAAGTAGGVNGPGGSGGTTIFVGDSLTITAHGGGGGHSSGNNGNGGTGSTNTITNPGGDGGGSAVFFGGYNASGAGGGSSGGPSSPGNQGSSSNYGKTSPVAGAAGGPAVSGGGPGAAGGKYSGGDGSTPAVGPGGGGGGGATGSNTGGAGKKGQIRLTYSGAVNLTGSITGQAGTDPVGGLAVPEGAKFDNLIVGTQLTATGGTVTNPTVVTTDTWHDTGGLTNGWGKGTGFFKYTLLPNNMVAVSAQGLTIGTATDGTTILTAANGLPPAYRPTTTKPLVADTNNIKVGSATYENARLTFNPDGTVAISGFNASATFANLNGIFPLGF